MTHVLSETFLEDPVVADDDPSPLTASFRLPRVFFSSKGRFWLIAEGRKYSMESSMLCQSQLISLTSKEWYDKGSMKRDFHPLVVGAFRAGLER